MISESLSRWLGFTKQNKNVIHSITGAIFTVDRWLMKRLFVTRWKTFIILCNKLQGFYIGWGFHFVAFSILGKTSCGRKLLSGKLKSCKRAFTMTMRVFGWVSGKLIAGNEKLNVIWGILVFGRFLCYRGIFG